MMMEKLGLIYHKNEPETGIILKLMNNLNNNLHKILITSILAIIQDGNYWTKKLS